MTRAISETLAVTTPSETEIVMTRSFGAPRALVFEAYTKPEHVRRWWGPLATTLPVCEMDFRPGGAYRFVCRDGGVDYGFRGEYREIVPPEKLSYTFEFEGMPGSVSVETLVFSEEDGVTTITSTAVYASRAERDAMLQSGMEQGAAETFDRLAELLQQLQAAR